MSGSMRRQGRHPLRGSMMIVIAALALVAGIVWLAPPASADVTVIDRVVAADADDAEEAIDGSLDRSAGPITAHLPSPT
jgi:hypothetical protein